jgi:Zn-finger nucleic acid-binding protein
MSLAHRQRRFDPRLACRRKPIIETHFDEERTMKPNLLELQIQMHQREVRVRTSNHTKPRKCPVCTETDLMIAQRQGIEIDYCPKCRGVWLDRGELERLIELATSGSPELRIRRAPLPGENDSDHRLFETAWHRNFASQPGRKRSWLKEIFE